ncbi:ankyrin repeat protein [Ancylostoma duodenale]|uniref:Ankyrin repeat protein n=1 Tax=Ancylostoma duodenale TaxID=51022 RepID=A0A0C2GVA5_9BILA|nr:ankyrin repeat protein [Ancylostoma duodenale]
MCDFKATEVPLLDSDSSNEMVHKSSRVTVKSSDSCREFLLPDHASEDISFLSSIAIGIDDSNVDEGANSSIIKQHARNGNVKELEALLDKHPHMIDEPDTNGLTALHYAAKYGKVEAAKLLLERGASLQRYTKDNHYAPLHMVAKYALVEAQQHSNRESAVQFIGASAHQAESQLQAERTPVASEVTTLVGLFVKEGADVNVKDKSGMTPLDHATLKNNETAVLALINNGANPNVSA